MPNSKRKIYVTGVMGSGKTSVAEGLSRKFIGSIVKEPIDNLTIDNTFNGSNEHLKALSQYNFLLDILRNQYNKLLNNTQIFDTSISISNTINHSIIINIKKYMEIFWTINEIK